MTTIQMIESCLSNQTPTGFQSSEFIQMQQGDPRDSQQNSWRHISFSSAPAGVTHAPVPYNFKLWGKRVAYDIMTSGSVTLQPLNSSPGQNKSISEKLACDAVDGRNPANQLICSLSQYLQGFSTIPGGCLGFLPSTVSY